MAVGVRITNVNHQPLLRSHDNIFITLVPNKVKRMCQIYKFEKNSCLQKYSCAIFRVTMCHHWDREMDTSQIRSICRVFQNYTDIIEWGVLHNKSSENVCIVMCLETLYL